MTTTIRNRILQQVADQKLIDGLNKHSVMLPTFLVGGQSLTPAAIVAAVQARITTASTVQSTKATWQAAIVADKAELANTQALVSGVQQTLQVAFAGSIDGLADFGLTPRKQAVISPEQRVAAAVKAKATRKARGTKGKKQKLAIKGAVPPTQATGA